MISLNSDLSETVFYNPKYVSNIRPANKILELGTNGGTLISTHTCDIPYLGTVHIGLMKNKTRKLSV